MQSLFSSQKLWLTSVISAFRGRLRQQDHYEFMPRLGCTHTFKLTKSPNCSTALYCCIIFNFSKFLIPSLSPFFSVPRSVHFQIFLNQFQNKLFLCFWPKLNFRPCQPQSVQGNIMPTFYSSSNNTVGWGTWDIISYKDRQTFISSCLPWCWQWSSWSF